MAGTIGDLGVYDVGTYGDGGSFAYGAQTFVAAGDNMQSLDLMVDAAGTGSSTFHLLVTTVKTLAGGQFQPGTVLKEFIVTETFDGDHTLHALHINLRGVELDKGVTYAFIVDRFVTKDGTPDSLWVAYNKNLYAGGFAADLATASGRTADFNANWDEYPPAKYDLAFKAVFSDAGETIFGTKKGDLIDSSHAPKGQSTASALDDKIYGDKGNDTLSGGDGFDYLNGGQGNDKLNGEGDGDVLVGGKGKDKLYGGDDEDSFVFDVKLSKKSAGDNFDKLYGFNAAEDAIYLDPTQFSALAPGDLPDTDTHITYKNGTLFYDGLKFAQFKVNVPVSLDEIHIVVA